LKPIPTDAPVARLPFQGAFVAVTSRPVCDHAADQPWVTRWLPGHV
jgi:hypothetical protein